jgi:F0F1-type ATP synthase assembly protein I
MALAAFLLAETPAVLAIIAGGLIGILATGLFCIRVFGGRFEWSPERFLQRFYRAEIQKLLLIAILLFCAIKWIGIGALPLLLGCVATLMANWLVLLIKL